MILTQETFLFKETLKDGRSINIRPLKDGDRHSLTTVWNHLSPLSIYHRFFSPKKSLSESDLAYLSHVDFKNHVALLAWIKTESEDSQNEDKDQEEPVAIGRYIVIEEKPRTAEIAFVVDDPYQGLGIGTILMKHLSIIGRTTGIEIFKAYVLSENYRMLAVFSHCGLNSKRTQIDGSTYEIELYLTEP